MVDVSDPNAIHVPPLEFHLSRLARERYQFVRDLYRTKGNLTEPDPLAIQDLTYHMNLRLGPQGRGVKPGHVYALALIQHILHRIIRVYRLQREPRAFDLAESWLNDQFSSDRTAATLAVFGGHYAPLSVFKAERSLSSYLASPEGDLPGRQVLLEQMLLVFFANANPAALSLRDLYDDREFPARDEYLEHIWSLERFFASQPPFGPSNQSLFELLSAPAKASPDSLLGQLEFIRQHWAALLGSEFLKALLVAEDLVREDEKMPWRSGPIGQGPDPEYLRLLASRAMFSNAGAEPERFSPDTDWMPRAVLLAKSVYVWLDQLTKRYGRPIHRLDEVPDEELDRLSGWGFTGLWLIGLWERSSASRTIKHIRGNTDAVASAYSLYDYNISGDLGGNEGLQNLKARALARGIRIASDMVPNHMGIDSVWTREHPDWFIQLPYPPYGAYHFDGPDLSGDPNIEVKIEDGYWNQTDAAVVFRRVDRRYGDTRFIYHGNDGTSMPWNDTAQLDFMKPEVREAVIQCILHVARQCSVIRFDAAMTLTKKHYQRLWYPEPGSGGAIPSRALYGLTREEFNRQMPAEFWREVVDRVAAEAPDTLLIAEAFWLLEGFFVRTLGMHRVYNSAFMNMLKLEENAKYRDVIKNVLEFDPRIIQRFVNFMNNPDEDTAVAQFGKGDKYFGVCLMMATMPGLPMFGHGQIEGLTEKYGHEYQRAYYDERDDDDLVRRHEREIFPVLRQRHLFSGAEHFVLYDVYLDSGQVEENVFAYSNGHGNDRSLVVFHNRYAETGGWIHTSAAFSVPDDHGGRKLIRRTLGEGLGLKPDAGVFYILRDRIAGLEYLRSGYDLCSRGLYVQLRAYQYQVFTDFREITDDADGRWARLSEALRGRGVPSVEREYKKVYLAPLITAFESLVTAGNFRDLCGPSPVAETVLAVPEPPTLTSAPSMAKVAAKKSVAISPPPPPAVIGTISERAHAFALQARPFLEQARLFGGGTRDLEQVLSELESITRAALTLPDALEYVAFDRSVESRQTRDQLVRMLPESLDLSLPFPRVLCGFLAVWAAGRLDSDSDGRLAARRLDDWLLTETLESAFLALGSREADVWREILQVRALLAHYRVAESFSALRKFSGIVDVLNDPAVETIIGGHPHGGVVWFHRESFTDFAKQLAIMTVLLELSNRTLTKAERGQRLARAARDFRQIIDISSISEFQLERFRQLLGYAAHYTGEGPAGPVRKKSGRKR